MTFSVTTIGKTFSFVSLIMDFIMNRTVRKFSNTCTIFHHLSKGEA